MLPEKQDWSWNLILCLKNGGKKWMYASLAFSHYPLSSHISRVNLSLEVSSPSLLPGVFIHWMNCQFPVVAGSQMFRQALPVSVTVLWDWAAGILGGACIGSITFQLSAFPNSKTSAYSLAILRDRSSVPAPILSSPTLPLLLCTPWPVNSQQTGEMWAQLHFS